MGKGDLSRKAKHGPARLVDPESGIDITMLWRKN